MIETLKGLWVDDERPLPIDDIDWDLARTYDQAIEKLSTIQYDVVSLDHDLGCYREDLKKEFTGYDIALFLVERKLNNLYFPFIIQCHSQNPVGRDRILGVIQRYLID